MHKHKYSICTMYSLKYILILCGIFLYTITIGNLFDFTKKNLATQYKREDLSSQKLPPPLYIITPTFRRPEQLAELTRLGYTLKHVQNLLWLVIEDANEPSILVNKTLNRIKVPYIYLQSAMPKIYKDKKGNKPKGVANRNRGIKWLKDNIKNKTKNSDMLGVFYFADDDNSYDVTLFEEIRYTKKISFFPVGLVTKLGVSSPILKNGKFNGWYDGWIAKRKYAVDMAGFAVSIKFLFQRPNAKMPFTPGYEEDGFIKSLEPIDLNEMEFLANNCTEILTWHTQTKGNGNPAKLPLNKYDGTNLINLTEKLVNKN